MSLRAFHLIFISMAAAMTLAFTWWAYGTFRVTEQTSYALAAFCGLGGAVALIAYGSRFYVKGRQS